MQIYTLWHENDDDLMPWLLNAVDEYTVEGAGLPPEYEKQREQPHVRELIIDIPESAVTKLFQTPTVKGTVDATK